MNVAELESQVLALPVSERRQFVDWLDEHRHELLPDDDDIHPSVKAEVLRRLKEVEEHPELLEPWDGTMSKARQQLDEFRRSQNQPR